MNGWAALALLLVFVLTGALLVVLAGDRDARDRLDLAEMERHRALTEAMEAEDQAKARWQERLDRVRDTGGTVDVGHALGVVLVLAGLLALMGLAGAVEGGAL